MDYFRIVEGRSHMKLIPGALTKTLRDENMGLSLVEIDANSVVPLHTHSHDRSGILI